MMSLCPRYNLSSCILLSFYQSKKPPNPDTHSTVAARCSTHTLHQNVLSPFLLLRPTTPPSFCSIGIDKETWIERKTKYAFGLSPLSDGIEYKELEVGVGPKALEGQVVNVRLTYTATAGGRKLERWWSLKFILGEEYQNVPRGVHIGMKGMRNKGRRLIVLPPEMMDYKYGSPVCVEIELLHLCEVNSLTQREVNRLGQSRTNGILTALHLREVVNVIKSKIFGIHYETEKEWRRRKEFEMIPAETEEEFLGEGEKEQRENGLTVD